MIRSVVAAIAGALLVIGRAAAQTPDLSEAWWAAVGPDGTQRINIRCGTDFIDPREIVIRANIPVALAVSTEANLVAHNFAFQLPGAAADAAVGPRQREFRFAVGLPGRYVLACRDAALSPGSPPQKQQQATLRVVP